MTERFEVPTTAIYRLSYCIDGGEWIELGVHELPIDSKPFDNIRLFADGTVTPILPDWMVDDDPRSH